MSGTVGNIIARVGADVSPLAESMKQAQNTILTFKDESLAALKSFGLPHISSTNLVESIQSGQRVVVNFAKESGESLAQFQQRVRTTFAEAGIDITTYERALTDADKIHAEFAKGAVKSFQAVSAAADEVNNTAQELHNSVGKSFSGISANISAFKDSVGNAFNVLRDGGASAGDKFGAVSNAVVDGFGLMTGAIEIFIAVEVVKKVGEWIAALQELAAETQDAEHRFYASMGSMSEEAEEFSKKLSESYGVDQEAIQNMMGKEYTNTRMLGFDPSQAEGMSEHLTQLAYDLGKLRGIDPSQAFDALQRGIEGQTRGLMDLGIRITTTDLKNQALSEGLIKQGQTMTDAQTSAGAYQMIMKKLQGTTGYYKNTADDLSTQQAKLNAGWDGMKRKLAEDLTPAFTGLMRVVSFVASGFEELVEVIGTAIQYISLFAEDAYSAVKDVLSMDFSSINADWANNYASIFNSSQAAKDYGNSMDAATSAANAHDAAQKALNKSVNANTMSFDQLHNITNSGAAGAQGQTDAVNNLADALANLKTKGMDSITNNQTKGIVIPVSFKIPLIPPIPPIPPPPPVVFPAVDNVTPVVETIKTELASLPGKVTVPIGVDDQTEPAYGNVRNKLDTFTPKLINVPVSVLGEALLTSTLLSMQTKLTGWQTAAVTCFNAVTKTGLAWETSAAGVFSSVQTYIQSWEAGAVSSFAQFQSSVAKDFSAAGSSIHTWSVDASQDFDEFTANAGSCISTFMNNLHNDLNQVFTSTETMAVSWANSIGETITKALNQAIATMAKLAAVTGQVIPTVSQSIWQTVSVAYTGVANWVENNKSWLVPLGVAAGAVGVTIATGGADLLAGGAAAAGSALAGTVSSIGSAIPAFASGGIVTSATLGVFGEAGPEAVIPLTQLDSMLSGASKSSGGSSQSISAQPINVTLKLDGRTLARTLYQYTVNENDRQGTTIGYNSSYNLPK